MVFLGYSERFAEQWGFEAFDSWTEAEAFRVREEKAGHRVSEVIDETRLPF